jgi:hypothetical protein
LLTTILSFKVLALVSAIVKARVLTIAETLGKGVNDIVKANVVIALTIILYFKMLK